SYRVFQRSAGDELIGPDVFVDQPQQHLPSLVGDVILLRVFGGDITKAHRADTDDLRDIRHRVGRELAAAGPRPRTGDILNRLEFFGRKLARTIGTDSFVYGHEVDILALIITGHDRPAVKHQRGDIQADERHDRA